MQGEPRIWLELYPAFSLFSCLTANYSYHATAPHTIMVQLNDPGYGMQLPGYRVL